MLNEQKNDDKLYKMLRKEVTASAERLDLLLVMLGELPNIRYFCVT